MRGRIRFFVALLLFTTIMLGGLIALASEAITPASSFDEAYAAYADYLPEIPVINSLDGMNEQERTNAFMETIQERADELGLLYMDWSLADMAWLSKVEEAYDVKAFREVFVLPGKGDCDEEKAIEIAREALSEIAVTDASALSLSYVSFSIRDGEQEPVWRICFGTTEQVYVDRHGEILDVQLFPVDTPTANQITQEEALDIVKTYLVDKLRFTPVDIEAMTFDPHFYLQNADNPCDFFLIHCYLGDEFTSVYVNADTGEVYNVGLPGLGHG